MNFLANAINFNPNHWEIKVQAYMIPDGAVDVIITDNGSGIRQRDMVRILKPFRQVQSYPELSHEGTGTGLPLANRLTERHGGTMTLKNTFSEGAKVRVTMAAIRFLG